MADLSFESTVITTENIFYIAGLDEAGRGALAGPVVAAAVILPLKKEKDLEELLEVNDSKQLTAVKRETLFHLITRYALSFGIGQEPAQVIDEIGIIPATKRAMLTAVSQLRPAAEYLLIDGRIRLTAVNLPQQAIIRGDSKSLSIAAASILAKVTRDRIMIECDSKFPRYGFAQSKGYGTEAHRQAIEQYGPCHLHRYSFAPIRKPLL